MFKKREEFGEYHRLVQELRNEDGEYFLREDKYKVIQTEYITYTSNNWKHSVYLTVAKF